MDEVSGKEGMNGVQESSKIGISYVFFFCAKRVSLI